MDVDPVDATPFLPASRSLKALREAAAACRGCHLWQPATQTVFGEGPRDARIMLVGEVPGDREDREGRPFVGPPGVSSTRHSRPPASTVQALMSRTSSSTSTSSSAASAASTSGPTLRAIKACRPWFRAELEAIAPEALILLGATAGKALLGSTFRLGERRGHPLDSDLAPVVLATIHPSAILRSHDSEARGASRAGLVADLRVAAALLASEGAA